MKNTKIIFIPITFIAILIFFIIAIILAMRGETKVAGDYPDTITGQSLICESSSISYPFFAYDSSKAKELKITATAYSEKMNSISLSYILYYNSDEQIAESEAQNHAAMNMNFEKNGLTPDALNIHYSKMDNSMNTSLYIASEDINVTNIKYFLINVHEKRELPNTINELHEFYKNQNFSCETSNTNQ